MANLTAKDLRIGNYVNFIGQPYGGLKKGAIEVDSVHEYGINISCSQSYGNCELDRIEYRDIEPIALSPSILEAAGFEKNKGWNEYYWKGDFTINEVNGGFEVFASEWTIGKTFNFVHELQNISFILFGIELTLNLNQLQQA